MISTSEMTQTEPEKREIIFQPNPGPQEQFLAADEQEVLYGGPLEISTLVKTSKGLEEIGDISIGDYVYTPNGSLTKVIEIPFEGEEESYKISFSNGAEVIASHGHKWKVGTSDWAKTQKEFRTRRTFELLNDYKLSRGRNRYYIPKVAPLYYKETPHLISPYIMGVLLSDGCIIKAITIFNEDLEVINRVVDELHEDYELSQDSRIAFRIVKKNREKGSKSLYKEELRRLKIFGKNAFQKSIPVQYLFDSVENRLSLLRGLMDCDGTVRGSEKNRGREAKYSTVSVALKNTFIQLAESLGFRTTYYSEELPNGNLIYRILINGELNPFYLKRKKHKYENCKTRLVNTYITNIEPVGVKKVKCITIEDPDHVFVLDRNIVTHNSAGGGKSFALLADALRDLGHPDFRGLILRRTTEELRELIQKSQELYPKVYPDIRWSERRSEWYFPKRPGGRLWMSYLDRDQDVTRYQGQAFNYIAFDELTQWPTPYPWDYMRSRLRTTSSSGLKLYMRCTANPGGLGGSWVKKTFIDPAPWGEAFNARDLETGKELIFPSTHSKAGQPLFQRRFIPAKLKDNPYLYEDGMYEANLLSLPEAERKRLLEGNWDVAEGVAFPEWNRSVHVIPPFDIPDDWRKFRSCDYGYGSYSAVLWFAVDNRDQLIVYRELYVSKVLAVDLADMVLDLERNDGQIAYGVLDSSCWANRGDSGPSIAEQMIRQGCKWRPSDRSKGSRVAGKNEIHRRLQVDEFLGEPRLVFFNNCVKCIDQIPGLPLDPDNPEDVYTKGEDHIYDALRYGCMTRPRSKIWDWNDNSGRSYTPVDPVFGW